MESVRGKDVYLLQPTCPPVNDNVMELLVFADACRRAAAGRIHAVVPYYGYARSDKRHGRREAITASMVALLMRAAGIDHVVTLDLHTDQVEGFFPGPFDTLTAVPTLCAALGPELPADAVVVSPDAGRVKLATEYATRLDRPLAVLHKRRESGTKTQVTQLVGEVDGRTCLIIDDMVSTGGTLVESVAALREAGAAGFRVSRHARPAPAQRRGPPGRRRRGAAVRHRHGAAVRGPPRHRAAWCRWRRCWPTPSAS